MSVSHRIWLWAALAAWCAPPAGAQVYMDPPLSIAIAQVPARPSTSPSASAPTAVARVRRLDFPAKFTVGVKTPGTPRGVWRATRLIAREEALEHLRNVRAIPGVRVFYIDEMLPFAIVEVQHQQALDALSAKPYIDYVESDAGDIRPQQVGCSQPEPTWSPATTPEGDIIPRAFPLNGITAAWRRHAFGQGVTVGVVDTGLARDQLEMRPEQFMDPRASGRVITYMGCSSQACLDAMGPLAFDLCGHGTRIAGAIGAPRNGSNIVGVAPRSSLQVAKAGDGVWCDNLVCVIEHLLGIRRVREGGARVIEMAFGGVTYSAPLADEISFQFHRTDMPEVLFVGAAGTSVCLDGEPVIFPARMPEVLAVTGVNPDGTKEESACTGPQVRLAVTLVDYETTGLGANQVITLGGTSGASALASGVAALMWSRQPRLSRDELIRRLTTRTRPSQINVPVMRADKAVGGVSTAHLVGW